MSSNEIEIERRHLIKVGEFDFYNFCYENKDVCNFCYHDWVHQEPCIFYKRILIMYDNKIKVYKIIRTKKR